MSRETQRQRTREAILDALVDTLERDGIHAFSVQRVADAAGVSHRTVYRHFPSRDALLEGLHAWLVESVRAEGRPAGRALDAPDADAFADTAAAWYAEFARHERLVRAMVALGHTVDRDAPRARNTAWIRDVARPLTRHLDPDDFEGVAAMLRLLGSSTSWLHARQHGAASQAALERAVRWAARTLIEDLRAGGGPREDEKERK